MFKMSVVGVTASTQTDRRRLHSSMAWFTTQTGPANYDTFIMYKQTKWYND